MTRSIARRTYTVPEVAALLGIGRSTAYDLVARGELAATRIGRRWIVSPVVLEQILGERPPLPRDLGSAHRPPAIPCGRYLNVTQRNRARPTPLDRSEKTFETGGHRLIGRRLGICGVRLGPECGASSGRGCVIPCCRMRGLDPIKASGIPIEIAGYVWFDLLAHEGLPLVVLGRAC